MAERPGIMVYFDLLDTLQDGYTTEEVGELFLAMLNYGRDMIIPEFTDRGMRTLWKGIQHKIDRDNLKYQGTVKGRRYAAFCREFKKKNPGIAPPSMEEWQAENSDEDQMISNDNFDIQLVTTTSNYNRERGTSNKDAAFRAAPMSEYEKHSREETEFEAKRTAALAALDSNKREGRE